MVRLNKSPQPKVIKSESDYQNGENFDTLLRDCHNKCYICENPPIPLEVEHIVPHKSDPKLKFDWNNLFIACGHCNKIKRVNIDIHNKDILDPTKCDPEEHIELSIKVTDDKVSVESLKSDTSTLQTKELLEKVYNDDSTSNTKYSSANLRKALIRVLDEFDRYKKIRSKDPSLASASFDFIREKIGRSSEFAAFKRKIIRDDPELSQIFSDVLV